MWTTTDPALGEYLPNTDKVGNGKRKLDLHAPGLANDWHATFGDLPGMGGAFEPRNMALYNYSHQNPLRFVDPDGRALATWLKNIAKAAGATVSSVFAKRGLKKSLRSLSGTYVFYNDSGFYVGSSTNITSRYDSHRDVHNDFVRNLLNDDETVMVIQPYTTSNLKGPDLKRALEVREEQMLRRYKEKFANSARVSYNGRAILTESPSGNG